MMLGSLNKSQISSKHGPGTSGGNGASSGGLGPISKKKYSLGPQHGTSEMNNFTNAESETLSFQNMNMTNPNESLNGSLNQMGQNN